MGKLKTSEAFPLSLPPCQKCNTPRINEHAKFCHNCGAQLKAISIFETLVAESIKKLPLTEGRVQTIINHSNIRTIKDILIDHDNNELRSVPQIGPVWSSRIAAYAEEFIG